MLKMYFFWARCYLACCFLWFAPIQKKQKQHNLASSRLQCQHSWMCFCSCARCFFLTKYIFFLPKNRSITCCFPIISSWPYPCCPWMKKPTCQSPGTVAISCVNFIVVPVPRSESVSKTVVFSWLERVWWVWGARLVVSWFWIRHVDVENLCWDTGWNLAIRILSTQPGQLFHPEMAEWGISW